MTITRCPTYSSTPANAQNSAFLNRIPASTTITPTQYNNSKDNSLTSSLSIYPKNSQSGSARSIIQSSVSPVIASPTRASPQAGYAKQPSISPAIIPAVIQQQLDELLMKQNLGFNGLSDPELLKQTLLTYKNLYVSAQQQNAGNQSLPSGNQSYPVRNKSVITTSRASAMDVIDLSASNSPTPSRSMSAATALQLQQAAAATAANKRAHNGSQYLNGNQSSRSMQSSSSASTRLQQQMQMNSLAGLNGYGAAYKIEKSFIENQMVHCINMIPYSPNSDMIIPLSELRDQFYPNANLDVCKRVMQALDINLYSGTKWVAIFCLWHPKCIHNILHTFRPQYQAYTELGKTIADNVPFVRVCDVITYMPQINYMVSGAKVFVSSVPTFMKRSFRFADKCKRQRMQPKGPVSARKRGWGHYQQQPCVPKRHFRQRRPNHHRDRRAKLPPMITITFPTSGNKCLMAFS